MIMHAILIQRHATSGEVQLDSPTDAALVIAAV